MQYSTVLFIAGKTLTPCGVCLCCLARVHYTLPERNVPLVHWSLSLSVTRTFSENSCNGDNVDLYCGVWSCTILSFCVVLSGIMCDYVSPLGTCCVWCSILHIIPLTRPSSLPHKCTSSLPCECPISLPHDLFLTNVPHLSFTNVSSLFPMNVTSLPGKCFLFLPHTQMPPIYSWQMSHMSPSHMSPISPWQIPFTYWYPIYKRSK